MANWRANVMIKWGWNSCVFVFGCYPGWASLLLQTWLLISEILLHSRGGRGIHTPRCARPSLERLFSRKLIKLQWWKSRFGRVRTLLSAVFQVAFQCRSWWMNNWMDKGTFNKKKNIGHERARNPHGPLCLFFHFSSTLSSLWTSFECWPRKFERQTRGDTTPGNSTGL